MRTSWHFSIKFNHIFLSLPSEQTLNNNLSTLLNYYLMNFQRKWKWNYYYFFNEYGDILKIKCEILMYLLKIHGEWVCVGTVNCRLECHLSKMEKYYMMLKKGSLFILWFLFIFFLSLFFSSCYIFVFYMN